MALSPEAYAALLGAAVGAIGSWGLAVVRDTWQAYRDRRVAAMLILTELTGIGAATSALRKLGVVTPPFPQLARPMWESNGAALLHGADLRRAGVVASAYSAAADLAAICTEPDRDFTQGVDAVVLDRIYKEILRGLREVMSLAGLSAEEVQRRMDGLDELHKREGS